ncbi:MAG: hypothetical protein KAS32_17665 [Candidatus Peribacteraceae bacterium]|nr:hypothetical protein [Candidatus Peribacteraceae bacterium]
MLKYLLSLLLLCSCEQVGYKGIFKDTTNYSIKDDYVFSPAGIKVYPNGNKIDLNNIDLKVSELEECLKLSIHRDWFSVYIPSDWYVSECSGQQLIPSLVDYKLCEAKGLIIEEECRGLRYPTEECPCPCNIRSGIQNNNVIITTPNLELFKMPLARMVLWPAYVLDNPEYVKCLW